MELPRYIEDIIIVASRQFSRAWENDRKLREWLVKELGVDEDGLEKMGIIDQLIDRVELGNDPLGFIKYLREVERGGA
jgi:hypothetical protein